MARELGDKLGPRLSRLIISHQLALRRGLAPIEATIAAAGTQKVIDRAGLETAEHYREIIGKLLAAHPNPEPWLVDYLQQTASGTHQWRSMAGVLGLTGISGGLSTVLANALSPAVQELVSLDPSIHIDQNAAASAAAARVDTYADALALSKQAGFDQDNFNILYNLAMQVPDAATLYDAFNRGLINEAQLVKWLGRLALPEELITPVRELARSLVSPADAALAVLRGNMSQADGIKTAAASGYTAADFAVLIGNTGEPPAMEEMLMLWRRGKITTATLDRAILQSRVRDEWIPMIHELAIEPPSAADVLEALVQGELSQSEAEKRYAEAGGDPTFFATAYATRANAPAPGQLAEMANRGIIPWEGGGANATSYHQGFVEGRWKNKWEPAFKALAVYQPPPREVATLVKEAGLSQDAAMKIWQQAGLSPEMAHMYWTSAHYTRTAALHHLAIGEIRQLYTDKAISRAEALKMAESIGWTEIDATWLLDLADLQLERKFLETAISKIHSLYISHKLPKTSATAALAELEVPASQANQLVKIWELEAGANVRVLTPAQIVDAWYYSLISPQEALTMLEATGYTPRDAWIVLNNKNKGKIKDLPEPGA